MAIINTHFFNISFEHQDLMKVLIRMSEYSKEIFPQNSKKIVNNVKGVSIMEDANPYNEPLDELYHILNRLNIDSKILDDVIKDVDLVDVYRLINDINHELDGIIEIKENIAKEKEENDEAIILLKNLEDAKISVDDVEKTKFVTFRFGKIPINDFNKIQYYRDYKFIYKVLNQTEHYVWVVYSGLTSNISEIDNAFSSMSFELIKLPEFAHGKINEAIKELSDESLAMTNYLIDMDEKLETLKNDYQQQLLEVFTRLHNLKKLYDHCRYVVDFSQKAAIYAFSSFDLKEINNLFKEIESIRVMELPVNIYENRNIVAPVLIKNNDFVKPFENILSIEQGDIFDPTTLVMLATLISFGIFAGDIATGLMFLGLGFLGTIKKTSNFYEALKRIGLAVLIGGVVYGRVFYEIELYSPIVSLSINSIVAIVLGFGVWLLALLIITIVKKITRRKIKI